MHLRRKSAASWAAFALLAGLNLAAARTACAQTGTFNFETTTNGTTTTFTQTSNGINATFSSPADPDGFTVGANPSSGSVLLTGQVLGDGIDDNENENIPLSIGFNRSLSSISLAFATGSFFLNTPQSLTLQAFSGGTLVGTVTTPGVKPVNPGNAEGVISFAGSNFDSVRLSTATATVFAIDNIVVVGAGPAAVPEPSQTAAFGLGLLGLSGLMLKARKRKASAAL